VYVVRVCASERERDIPRAHAVWLQEIIVFTYEQEGSSFTSGLPGTKNKKAKFDN